MAGGIFVGSVYATMELQTRGFGADIARAQTQLAGFDKSTLSSGKIVGNYAQQANQHFSSIADGISGLVKTTVALGVTGSIGLAAFVKTAAGLQTTSKQMEALIGNADDANKIFGELYNYTLGKPIAFPDASKAAATLIGYGRSAKDVMGDMKTLSTLAIVNGADLQALSLVFGQVTSRGALFGQDALQLINNRIPLTTILAKELGVSMEEAAGKINGGKISAEQFTRAMDNYAKSLDISKFSDTFDNRLLSMRGSIRAFGNAILGLRIDPIRGLVIESGGLFDRLSQGITNIGPALKSITPQVKAFVDFMVTNFNTIVAGIGALGAAWATAKIGEGITGLIDIGGGFASLIGLISKATATQWGFNAAMTANPVGAVVVGIVALVSALTFLQIRFNIFGKALSAIKPAIDTIRSAFTTFWNAIKPIRDFVGEQLRSAFESLISIGKQLAQSFQPVINALKAILANQTVQTVLKAIGIALLAIVAAPVIAFFAGLVAAITVVSKVLGFIATHFETIKKVIGVTIAVAFLPLTIIIAAIIAIVKNWGSIMNGFKAVFSAVGAVVSAVGNVIKTVFTAIWTVITTVFNVINAVWSATLKPVFTAIIYVVTAVGKIFWTVFTGIIQVVGIVVKTIAQIIGVILYGSFLFLWNNVLKPTARLFSTIFTAIVNNVRMGFNTVRNIIVTVMSAVWSFIQPVVTRIVSFFKARWDTLVANVRWAFNLFKTYIVNPVRDAVSAATNAIGRLASAVKDGVTRAYNAAKNFASQFVAAGKALIDGLVQGVQNGKDAVVNKVKEIASGALDAVKNFFGIHSPSRVMMGIGTDLMRGMSIGIQNQAQNMRRTMYQASDNIQRSFTPQLSAAYDQSNVRTGSVVQTLQQSVPPIVVHGDLNMGDNKQTVDYAMKRIGREGELSDMNVVGARSNG